MGRKAKRAPAQQDREQYIQRVVREQVRKLSAYHVPPAQGMIKLDAMENPYRWPAALADKWLQELRNIPLNRYPDPTAGELVTQLRNTLDIPEAAGVLLGNGSDELIQMMALASAGLPVLSPTPSFVMYQMIATFVGSPFIDVPLRKDFSLDRDALLAQIKTQQPALIFFAYPNNPTGNLFDRDVVEAAIELTTGLVVVDEAYQPFADDSWMGQVMDYPNLVVMRTFSKLGLAGLRLGYLVGHPAWLDEFNKVRMPYNINVLTQTSIRFALQHAEVFTQQAVKICSERERMFSIMNDLPNIEVFPSATNFLLFRVAPGASQVFDGLYSKNILIKNLHKTHSALENCLRVTVGTSEENEAFLSALAALLEGN